MGGWQHLRRRPAGLTAPAVVSELHRSEVLCARIWSRARQGTYTHIVHPDDVRLGWELDPVQAEILRVVDAIFVLASFRPQARGPRPMAVPAPPRAALHPSLEAPANFLRIRGMVYRISTPAAPAPSAQASAYRRDT